MFLRHNTLGSFWNKWKGQVKKKVIWVYIKILQSLMLLSHERDQSIKNNNKESMSVNLLEKKDFFLSLF